MATVPGGSLNDWLPKPGDPTWDQIPPSVRDDIELIRNGYRPIAPGELDDIAQLPKRIEGLAIEQRVLASTVRDVHKAQSELGSKLLAILAEIQKEQAEHRSQLNDHDKRLDAHDVQLGVHAKKHVEHTAHITGVHKRLELVEKTISQRPKRKTRKKAK